MASINTKLDFLRRLRRPVREAAWLAALAVAAPDEADALVAEIIDHHRELPDLGLLARVVARWADLSPQARRAAAAAASDRLPDLLASLVAEPSSPDAPVAPESRQAAILVLADVAERRAPGPDAIGPAALAPISALTGEDLSASAPAEALGVAALALADPTKRIGLDPAAEASLSEALDRALAAGAARFDAHRSTLLMDAVLDRATHPGPNLGAWLADESEPGHMALRASVRRLSRDQAARRVVALLGVPALAGACVERLERLDEPGLQVHLMLDAPLLLTRNRTRAVRRMTRPETILPGPDALRAMPPRARLGYVRWVQTLALPGARRLERLGVAAADADPRVRLATVRAIACLEPTPTGDEALAQLAADADVRVASAAAGALATARSEHRLASIAALASALRQSPHASVRQQIERLVRRAPRTNEAGRPVYTDPVVARRALLRARDETLTSLRCQIAGADRAERMAAIEIVARLDLLHLTRAEILEAAESPDPYVAAKAARALARLPDAVARRRLTSLVEHKDPRVGADAIEALDEAGDIGRLDLERLANHPTPRIRANTLHAMLHAEPRGAHARAALAEMLGDERPEHRRSALWLSQRCAVTEMADRVAQIVRTDPDEATRARARRCGRRLLAEMRRAWAHPTSAAFAEGGTR